MPLVPRRYLWLVAALGIWGEHSGMSWSIPNLVLHDKSVRLANMRTHGRRHVFVNCGNPDCYHNAELDVSGLPDNVTFGGLQRRMLCTVCDHRGADIARLHHD